MDMKISEMVRAIMENAGLPNKNVGRIQNAMSAHLKELGLTRWEDIGNGRRKTVATDKGREMGIVAREFVSANGEKYETLLFGEKIQELLASKIADFARQASEAERISDQKRSSYFAYITSQACTMYRHL